MDKNKTAILCPRCYAQFVVAVSCSHDGCSFNVSVCNGCDDQRKVSEFMADHEDDCDHTPDRSYVDKLLRLTRPAL